MNFTGLDARTQECRYVNRHAIRVNNAHRIIIDREMFVLANQKVVPLVRQLLKR